MTFAYNENGCKVIRDYFAERLKLIRHDISFLEQELSIATELAAHIAIDEQLGRRRFEEAFAQQKIAEMERHLASLAKP
jgi:hypothetical protein